MAERSNLSDFSSDSSWSAQTEDSSDDEQGIPDGTSIQPYQYEPEDEDISSTGNASDSDPADDDPEDDPRLGNTNW